ncbi:hypothetical protein CTA1_2151, partial [Colletotrichum tanaceti]
MCYDDPGTVIIRTEGVNGIFRIYPDFKVYTDQKTGAGWNRRTFSVTDLEGTAVHTLLDSGLVPGDFHHARLGEIFFGLWPGPNFRDKTTGEIIDAWS